MKKATYYALPFAVIPVLMLITELVDNTVLRMSPTILCPVLCMLCAHYGYHTPRKKFDLVATVIPSAALFICMLVLGFFAENDLGSRLFSIEKAIRTATQPTILVILITMAGTTALCSLAIGLIRRHPKLKVRNCTLGEDLSNIRSLYEDAFPECERKPFDVMARAIGSGLDMCALEEGGEFVGLAITLVHGDIALLDYFATAPHRRGCGIGASALELLKKKYSGRALLIEIEDPDDECDNPEIRRRRLTFYKRCGMALMPYKVYFYGTKMLTLTSGGCVDYPSHVAVYENVLGDEVAKNIVLCDE